MLQYVRMYACMFIYEFTCNHMTAYDFVFHRVPLHNMPLEIEMETPYERSNV